jgi:hypothetical protein
LTLEPDGDLLQLPDIGGTGTSDKTIINSKPFGEGEGKSMQPGRETDGQTRRTDEMEPREMVPIPFL